MKTPNNITLLLVVIGVAIIPLTSYAQISIGPGTCPPGFIYTPPATCIPAPSPSPTPTLRDPIILVPGITVSQNKKLLYKDDESGKWKFAFGFNVYKGLIKKLETAGYKKGKNLFIAHYDWRNSATYNATTYLKPIINQAKQETGANKVDVIAHSFGGIVTRAYIQNNNYTDDIDQLITLGSPHQGSSDSYVAWEGGIYPEGWKFWIKDKVNKVEKALKKSRNQSNIKRPESFRTFFPSLRDMLPLQDFVNKEGSLLTTTNLVEQNSFLKQLHDTFSNISAKNVSLTTIAGASMKTLEQVNVTSDRDFDDIKLTRWRDGHAENIPPPLDSTIGDARVLLSSAHIGSKNITINDAVHHRLPDEAQNQVFDILGLEPQPSFFSTFPKKIFSILILSPVEVVINGPNGETLSQNQNDFGKDNAEYDDDLDDSDDPIEITIVDPPDGLYTATYTGTDNGDYTIITSYADEDEVVSSTKEGTTFADQQWTKQFYIGNDTSSLIDDADYKTLLKEIRKLAKQAKKDKLIKGYQRANITRPVTHALNDLRIYERRLKKGREAFARQRLRSYYKHLREIERVAQKLDNKPNTTNLSTEILDLLGNVKLYSPSI